MLAQVLKQNGLRENISTSLGVGWILGNHRAYDCTESQLVFT